MINKRWLQHKQLRKPVWETGMFCVFVCTDIFRVTADPGAEICDPGHAWGVKSIYVTDVM